MIELPVLVEYETNAWELRHVRFNPLYVMTVEPDPDEPSCCILTLSTGTYWNVQLTPAQYEKKVREWQRQNILSLYSKDNNG